MNKPRFALFVLIGILILACNLPAASSTAASPTDTAVPTAAEAVDVATDTPAPIPTITMAPSPGVPMASPSNQAVNCRSGPALGWDVLTLIQFGQSVEIVGKNADASWLEVKSQALGGGACWISAGVVSVTGNLGSVPIVAAPIPPTGAPTSVVVSSPVSSVSISLSKDSFSLPGCKGPPQQITIYATIWVNRAVTLHWHFATQQTGNLQSHALILSKATGKDVSESFLPKVQDGKFWVKLVIDGVDLSGMDASVTYKISC